MTDDFDGCRLTREGHLVHLCLDGSDANALGRARYGTLTRVAQELSSDEVLLLSAAGPTFSAGQNLREYVAAQVAGSLPELVRQGAGAVLALLECRATVVAAVQGPAVGGGALVAAAADVVVLGDRVRMRLPELELGLPLGASVFERLVGPGAARRLVLTGAWAEADELARWGAAERAAGDDVLEAATARAHALLGTDATARAEARRLFGLGERARAAAAYRAELTASLELLS